MLGQPPGPQERSCRVAAVTKHGTECSVLVWSLTSSVCDVTGSRYRAVLDTSDGRTWRCFAISHLRHASTAHELCRRTVSNTFVVYDRWVLAALWTRINQISAMLLHFVRHNHSLLLHCRLLARKHHITANEANAPIRASLYFTDIIFKLKFVTVKWLRMLFWV